MLRNLSILCAISLTFISCSTQEHPSKNVVSFNITDDIPETADPRKARTLSSLNVARMLFEGLTRWNLQGKLELAIADSIELSSDCLTYTIHLRKSAWSDGQPLTAEDVFVAWRSILSPDFPAPYASLCYHIKNSKQVKTGELPMDSLGITKIDDYTLKVELESPVPYFKELLALPPFFPVPAHIVVSNPEWASKNLPLMVSNGPFHISEWKNYDIIALDKNPLYWEAAQVEIEGIRLFMLDQPAELSLFSKGELDWAGSPLSTISYEAISTLKNENLLHFQSALGTYFYRFNSRIAPFNNTTLRRAFSLALDRKLILENVTMGAQTPAYGFLPPSLALQKTPYFVDASPEQARKLFAQALEEMNMTKETLPKIVLSYNSSAILNHKLAQAIQQEWENVLGTSVQLQAKESQVFNSDVIQGNYMIANGSWIGDFSDPINFLEIFQYADSTLNRTGWQNPQYQAYLEQSSMESESSARKKALHSAETILMEEMPIAPLFYYTFIYQQNPNLKNVVLLDIGQLDFRWAKFEKSSE